jgi:4-hydroxybenzoate polyprenyltransferase
MSASLNIASLPKLLRVKQWIKNGFVFAPLLFSLKFTDLSEVLLSLFAFIAFCFASSFVYIINDISDRKADAAHPKKRRRPIASRKVSVSFAVLADALCFSLCCLSLYLLSEQKVSIMIAAYIALNLLYSWRLKHIPLIDVFSIAFGFVLRIYAGAYAIGAIVSGYMFMVTLFISMFLALGKRKAELAKLGVATRRSLAGYKTAAIDQYITLFAAAVIISYSLYALDQDTVSRFGNALIYSVVFVIYGICRYMAELDGSANYDDPTDNLYRDKSLMLVCAAYAAYVIAAALWAV